MAKTSKISVMKQNSVLQAALLLILVACVAAPAAAVGTKYLDGNPDLTAYTSGTNEYSAGSDIQITFVVENNGMSLEKEVGVNLVTSDDPPTTAKFVTVDMETGNAPLIIKSDPQMIGDLRSQTRKTVTFNAKVNPDAPAGTYMVPLNLSYTRIDYIDQVQADSYRYVYVKDNMTVNVPVVIKAEVIPEIVSVTSDHLVAGADGYLNVTVKNAGSFDGKKATVKIVQNDDSPVTPVDTSVFLGDFPANSTSSCQYKVTVAGTAQNKSYPIDVVVIYQNAEGDFVTSRNETAGVNVGNKIDFEIQSLPFEMSPGSTKTLQVEYKNIGNSTVKGAQARISAVIPFTGISDVAYLGDIAPGQSAVASFEINVARDATLKDYGLDSEIRYRDALDNTYISDTMKVPVNVQNLPGLAGVLSHPVYISLIIAAIIGVVYLVIHFMRKKQ
ncbi:MAG TPA: S-layer protein [Methanoregula sp.]|nr:S-layer protein [Methanoregula sp.]